MCLRTSDKIRIFAVTPSMQYPMITDYQTNILATFDDSKKSPLKGAWKPL